MQFCLALAYASRALIPETAPFDVGVPLSGLAAFHATSALWYACRWDRVLQTDLKGVTWISRTRETRSLVAGAPLSRAETVLGVTAALLQYPVHVPAAAAAPFLVHTALGLPTTSNVVFAVESLSLCVTVLFENALWLSLLSTAFALYGYGNVSARTTPRGFAWTVVAHVAVALSVGAVLLARGGVHDDRVEIISATLSGVLCAEARLRSAARPSDARRQVVWASRTAVLCSASTLVFRACAPTSTFRNHVATAGLALLAVCATWHWHLDTLWRRHASIPWRFRFAAIPTRAVGVATAVTLAGFSAPLLDV